MAEPNTILDPFVSNKAVNSITEELIEFLHKKAKEAGIIDQPTLDAYNELRQAAGGEQNTSLEDLVKNVSDRHLTKEQLLSISKVVAMEGIVYNAVENLGQHLRSKTSTPEEYAKNHFVEFIENTLDNAPSHKEGLEQLIKAKEALILSFVYTAHPTVFHTPFARNSEWGLTNALEGSLGSFIKPESEINRNHLSYAKQEIVELIEGVKKNVKEKDYLTPMQRVTVATENITEEECWHRIDKEFNTAVEAWNRAVVQVSRNPKYKDIDSLDFAKLQFNDKDKENLLQKRTWNKSADADGRELATSIELFRAIHSAIPHKAGDPNKKYDAPRLDLRQNAEVHRNALSCFMQRAYTETIDDPDSLKFDSRLRGPLTEAEQKENEEVMKMSSSFKDFCNDFAKKHNAYDYISVNGNDEQTFVFQKLDATARAEFLKGLLEKGLLEKGETLFIPPDVKDEAVGFNTKFLELFHKFLDAHGLPPTTSLNGLYKFRDRDETAAIYINKDGKKRKLTRTLYAKFQEEIRKETDGKYILMDDGSYEPTENHGHKSWLKGTVKAERNNHFNSQVEDFVEAIFNLKDVPHQKDSIHAVNFVLGLKGQQEINEQDVENKSVLKEKLIDGIQKNAAYSTKNDSEKFEEFLSDLKQGSTGLSDSNPIKHYESSSSSKDNNGTVEKVSTDERRTLADVVKRLFVVKDALDDVESGKISGVVSDRYQIANFEEPADFYAMLLLMQQTELIKIENGKVVNKPKLGIQPLIETVQDMRNAPKMFEKLLEDPLVESYYKQHGKAEFMLGFSDGAKSGGSFASEWEIYKCMRELHKVFAAKNIEVEVFEGRGRGTGRGGLIETGLAAHTVPPEIAVSGRRDQTIQSDLPMDWAGSADYGTKEITGLMIGTMKAQINAEEHFAKMKDPANVAYREQQTSFEVAMDKIEKSAENYEFLVKNDSDTVKFLTGQFSNKNASSRNSKREETEKKGLEPERAVPVEINLAKAGLPVHSVGLKMALDEFIKDESNFVLDDSGNKARGIHALHLLYEKFPLFRTQIDKTVQEMADLYDPEKFRLYARMTETEKWANSIIGELGSQYSHKRDLSQNSVGLGLEDILRDIQKGKKYYFDEIKSNGYTTSFIPPDEIGIPKYVWDKKAGEPKLFAPAYEDGMERTIKISDAILLHHGLNGVEIPKEAERNLLLPTYSGVAHRSTSQRLQAGIARSNSHDAERILKEHPELAGKVATVYDYNNGRQATQDEWIGRA